MQTYDLYDCLRCGTGRKSRRSGDHAPLSPLIWCEECNRLHLHILVKP